jgi:hypothetical protein
MKRSIKALIISVAACSELVLIEAAQAKPLLDSDTKQVIYQRICAARKNDYTMKELFDYSNEMIAENGNLEQYPPLSKSDITLLSHDLTADMHRSMLNISRANIKHRNTIAVLKQSKSLIDATFKDRNCLPPRAFK